MIDLRVRKLVLQLEIAWTQGDLDAVIQLFGADAVISLADERRYLRSRDQVVGPLRKAMTTYPSMRVELRRLEVMPGGCVSTWLEFEHGRSATDVERGRSFGLAVWCEGPDGVRIRTYCETTGHSPKELKQ